MSKFGSLNNFQLTREAHELKQRIQEAESKLINIANKTNEIAKSVFNTNDINIDKFIETIDKSVDTIVLKKRIELLEEKLQKHKMYSIQISNDEKEKLQSFLNEQGLDNFYSTIIELGARTIEDILFLTESDLISYGFSIISIRKCLNSAKTYIETNQM